LNIICIKLVTQVKKKLKKTKIRTFYGRTLSERPCYILLMFFLYIFYSRLSWPNGWTDRSSRNFHRW